MKELSIEEKSKAYDEAIERAKEWFKPEEPDSYTCIVESIFPELKESEDEKIRKEIIAILKYKYEKYPKNPRYSNVPQLIAWLGNQGEPTEINPSEFDLRLNKLLKQFETLPKEELASILSFYLNVVQNGTYKEEKQGEQKSYASETMNEKWDFDSGFTRMMEKEQKPAEWNEEDEINLGKAIWYIENPAPMVAKDSMLVEWLKNLRGRVQSQHKQEWNEDDEMMLGKCIDAASGYYSPEDKQSMKDWLKSLRPQSQWKPSELQLECLDDAIKHYQSNGSRPVILMELLEELKKL